MVAHPGNGHLEAPGNLGWREQRLLNHLGQDFLLVKLRIDDCGLALASRANGGGHDSRPKLLGFYRLCQEVVYAGPAIPCTPSFTFTVVTPFPAAATAAPASGFDPVPAVSVR